MRMIRYSYVIVSLMVSLNFGIIDLWCVCLVMMVVEVVMD